MPRALSFQRLEIAILLRSVAGPLAHVMPCHYFGKRTSHIGW
jgi:hypothetical protein